jgi:hypothetical protein
MWRRFYTTALTVGLVGLAIAFFAGGKVQIGNRYTLDYGEGMVWWQSIHITDYDLVYKPMERYPYTAVQYTPGYHLVTRMAAALSGDWLWSARLISLAAALGWVLALGVAVYRILPARVATLDRLAAALFGPVLILPLRAFEFIHAARVDALALCFSACGLALFLLSRWSLVGQLLACVLFVAAILTKQSLYAAALGCLLPTLIARPARGMVLSIFTALCLGAPLAYLSSATHGGFLLNTAAYNLTPLSATRLLEAWSRNLAQLAPLAAMALVEVGLVAMRLFRFGGGAARRRLTAALERSPFHRAEILLTSTLGFAAMQALSVAKVGSNYNYFMELDLACAVLASLFLFRVLRLPSRPVAAPAVAVLLYALLLVATAFPAAMDPFSPSQRVVARDREAHYARALQLVRDSPGLVYAEDVSLLMAAGKEVPAEAFTVTILMREGRWDEAPFVSMIRERKFDAIVVTNLAAEERYTPAVRAAILEAYEPRELVGPEYTFYRRRS